MLITSKEGVDFMPYYNNWIKEESMSFAIQISDLCEKIDGCSVYVNQALLSSSLIGVNIRMAKSTPNKTDIIQKYEEALDQCVSTEYWIDIQYKKGKIAEEDYKNVRTKSILIRRKLLTVINASKKSPSIQKK